MNNQISSEALTALTFLQQDDLLRQIERIGREPFITVARINGLGDKEHQTYWCAFLPISYVENAMKDYAWDLRIGGGHPGMIGWDDPEYSRFGRDDEIEPLVYCKTFYGLRPDELELSQEFTLFYEAFFDASKCIYAYYETDGTITEIARIKENSIAVSLRHLKQFLAAKQMVLAFYFQITRWCHINLADLGLKEFQSIDERQGNTRYYRHIQRGAESEFPSASALIGKKLINGYSKSELEKVQNSVKQYEEFIFRSDTNGDSVTSSCNMADKHPAADYLTTIFFRKEVFKKYYDEPGKYSVEDGYLRCGFLWGISLDNNHNKYVGAFLGDLARDMPYSEQRHWKHFNVIPEDGPSIISVARNFLCQFAEPNNIEFKFKARFNSFKQIWHSQLGWDLFKDLLQGDEFYLTRLHVPVTDDPVEFKQQIQSLALILVESLNGKEIEKFFTGVSSEGSINKLKSLIDFLGLKGSEKYIKFLRDIRDLRNVSGAHPKGSNYERVAKIFGLGLGSSAEVISGIMSQASELINWLEIELLSKLLQPAK